MSEYLPVFRRFNERYTQCFFAEETLLESDIIQEDMSLEDYGKNKNNSLEVHYRLFSRPFCAICTFRLSFQRPSIYRECGKRFFG